MPELLFEIGTEELPANYVSEAEHALGALALERLAEARLSPSRLETFATPRRLAFRAYDIPEHQSSLETLRRGPALSATFHDGVLTQAGLGFARANKVDPDTLEQREGYVYARLFDQGASAKEVLPELLAGLVRDLPAPRKMRWGNVETAFCRPIAWLVAKLDHAVLPVDEAGVVAGATTRGHRVLAKASGEIALPRDYECVLKDLHVIANSEERRATVLRAAQEVVAQRSTTLELVWDDDLLDENTNLVELPIAILGSFHEHFLELPDEVLAEVMIVHQRYFPVRSTGGRLANHFVAISNNHLPDEEITRRGFEAVLGGRLSDAKFFWDADIAQPLHLHRERLKGMAFQRGLGTLWDKAERVEALALQLAESIGGMNLTSLRSALPLFKADLGTQMVYEFPELAGVMGRAYAEREGKPAVVAQLLSDAMRPISAGSPLPELAEGALISVADRLDTLLGFFSMGKAPSGSADPFGLRRAGIGLVRTLVAFGWEFPLESILEIGTSSYRATGIEIKPSTTGELATFLRERLWALLEDEHLEIQEMRAAGGSHRSLIGAARGAHLLHALRQTAGFEDLANLYKRSANITKDFTVTREIDSALLDDDNELALYKALPMLERAVNQLLERAGEIFSPWDPGSLQASNADLDNQIQLMLAIKPALDAFLDRVLVNATDDAVKLNRLTLLARIRDAIRQIAHLELL